MNDAFPLRWPDGWPRTAEAARANTAPFKAAAEKTRREILAELRRMHATNVVVNSNVPIRNDGMPYADAAKRRIHDPGVALYFTLKGRQLVMARDKYWRPEDNLRSLYLTIVGLRAIERHGGATMMERAFSGFASLPPPPGGTSGPEKRDWRVVLGFEPSERPTRDDVQTAFRRMARDAHPDAGGSDERMQELNVARDEALEALA